jgi:hypothetical protein
MSKDDTRLPPTDSTGDTPDTKLPKLTLVQKRAINASVEISLSPPEDIAYQHTVFCQTCLPYRNPGDDVRVWERRQGQVLLRVEAGSALNPETDQFEPLGLPFGPKSRLILSHLNSEALKKSSPVVEVEGSFTGFVKRVADPIKQGRSDPNGRELKVFKTQLSALAASTIRLGVKQEQRAITIKSDIIQAFDLWFPKDDRQRVLWPSVIQLSEEYFNSLAKHAVPLDERALFALAHSAMALDVYTWLAQRLHRIPANRPQFISWAALKAQFGEGYSELKFFRRVFMQTLRLVYSQYQTAQIEINGKGMTLFHSLPPVPPRGFVVKKPPEK